VGFVVVHFDVGHLEVVAGRSACPGLKSSLRAVSCLCVVQDLKAQSGVVSRFLRQKCCSHGQRN